MLRSAVVAALVVAGMCRLAAAAEQPLVMLVMDPLAAPLACPCVEGHAQRKYEKLTEFLAARLGRPVKAVFAEDLGKGLRGEAKGRVDLIIGKQSVVISDAKQRRLPVRPLAMLTGQDGTTTLTGLFVVRTRDPARQLSDLKGYTVLFGPAESFEKHGAALAALRAAGIEPPKKPEVRGGCSDAAIEMVEDKQNRKLAAVISSYAMPLLEGCRTVEKGSLRLIGQTKPVPFITMFASDRVGDELGKRVQAALFAAIEDIDLLKALESKLGFIETPAEAQPPKPPQRAEETVPSWPGWRGPRRDAVVDRLPKTLPAAAEFLWTTPLTGSGLSGVAATEEVVIVADRDSLDNKDVFRCLDALTGAERWNVEYPAAGKLDYGNSPRATPLLHAGRAYLLGAFGDLHCVDLADGSIVWKRNLRRDYRAKLPTWGWTSSPLVADGLLIVNPGAAIASLVALDPATGKERWRCAGAPAAYGSFIVGQFGGVRQIVGYDAASLGGWDIASGKRLWMLVPPQKGDFNVPTPIALDGKLLVSSENNGTRLYGFDRRGVIRPKPLAEQIELAPDASTPLALDGKVFGCHGQLFCLDAGSLKMLWTCDDKAFGDYVSFIGGSGRVLATTVRGELLLFAAGGERWEVISRLQAVDGGNLLSHPALVGDRLYLRGLDSVRCLLLP